MRLSEVVFALGMVALNTLIANNWKNAADMGCSKSAERGVPWGEVSWEGRAKGGGGVARNRGATRQTGSALVVLGGDHFDGAHESIALVDEPAAAIDAGAFVVGLADHA